MVNVRSVSLSLILLLPALQIRGGSLKPVEQNDVYESHGRAVLLDEHFDGPQFPPPGWTLQPGNCFYGSSYSWTLGYNGYAGGISPEAVVDTACWCPEEDYWTYLMTPAINTQNANAIALRFKHAISLDDGALAHSFIIYATADGSQWDDITPWANPPYLDIGPEIRTIDLSAYIGPATSVAFYLGVPYSADCIHYWAVDDVRIFQIPTNQGKGLKRDGTPREERIDNNE